jgi:protein TIF31
VAIEGAIAFIDGKITPLNQGDEKKKHICIYNKMFFSIANETVYDRSQLRNDDSTPTSSTFNTDLINIEAVQKLKIPELHILHMIMINYRGFNVIAQSIIPGIITIDQS